MSTNPDSGSEAPGAEPAGGLQVGDPFPTESLLRSGAALAGPAVVYFYPKDGTSTCTRQAAAFQRALPQYQEAGVEIIGVSTDDTDSHQCFARDEGIGFHLVSDPDASLTTSVGVLKDYGEYGELAARVTFLLDAGGTVRQRYELEDDVTSHPADVLSEARRLGLVSGDGGGSGHEGGAAS